MPLRVFEVAPTKKVADTNTINDIATNTTFTNDDIVTQENKIVEAAATISSSDSTNKMNNISLLPALIHSQVNHSFEIEAAAMTVAKKKKYSVQFYATPSASFRVLSDQKVKELIQPSLIAIPINSPLVQTPTFNQAVRHRPDIVL